ncbi:MULTISPECIES: BMP family lipoprotein [unclassified Arthrobacter]|uniref:BMP family lipoprotein n=1 Tax=unclassified Arthrobacter TaxID=235627 RepID=UPI001CE2EB02|nr:MULTISPECIES: BMP family ABC transporter substrate-binding protein [unclassified Arthrobacter]MBE0008971.1 BMP family ABC transporter substrate-binding protein [Arthrobacter sp. AET 35A]
MKNSQRTTTRLNNKTALSAAMLGASALLIAGCGAAPEEPAGTSDASGEATEATVDYTGCIVSDAGGFDDQSFNQSSYEGLTAARDSLGIEIREAESQAETDFGPNVNSMVTSGCDMIVTVGFLLSATTAEAAEANPDTNFAIVDDNDIELDNVKPIIYDTAQAAFLAGYAAAGTTQTGTVATYGGIQIPTVTIFMDGFADGVAYYNEQKGEDVQLLGWDKEAATGTFTGDFESLANGKTNTENFINEGADIIMPVAGPVGLGTIEAVEEANADGADAKVIWVDSDGFLTVDAGNEFILTSVMKLMGEAVEEVISTDVDGNFDNTPYVGTLENGGVALAPFHDQEAAVSDELKAELEEIQAGIISGDITVDSDASPES